MEMRVAVMEKVRGCGEVVEDFHLELASASHLYELANLALSQSASSTLINLAHCLDCQPALHQATTDR